MSAEQDVPDYETEFAYRFTKDDQEFQKYLKRSADTPPIVENWKSIEGGSQRNRDNRFEDSRSPRGRGGGRRWSRDNYNQQRQGRGWGNGSHPYGQQRSYSPHTHGYQSYNPYEQHQNHSYH